jgi:hypothetical protein
MTIAVIGSLLRLIRSDLGLRIRACFLKMPGHAMILAELSHLIRSGGGKGANDPNSSPHPDHQLEEKD